MNVLVEVSICFSELWNEPTLLTKTACINFSVEAEQALYKSQSRFKIEYS